MRTRTMVLTAVSIMISSVVVQPAFAEPTDQPVITSVYPASGLTIGGSTVVVSGSGLDTTTAVQVDTTTVSQFTVNADSIQFAAPQHAAGPVQIQITTSDGTTSPNSDSQYTYLDTGTQSLSWSGPYSFGSMGPLLMACTSRSWCLAVDGGGDSLEYDGDRWGRPLSTTDVKPAADELGCGSPKLCVATASGSGEVYTWNGRGWTSTFKGGGYDRFVSCPSASKCIVVTSWGQVRSWNGSSWHVMPKLAVANKAGSLVQGLACPNAKLCLAMVGPDRIYKFNGKTWAWSFHATKANGVGPYLDAVSCASVVFCVATDSRNNALTFDGKSWHRPQLVDHQVFYAPDDDTPPELLNPLTGLSCTARTFCMTVEGNGYADRYNGKRWVHLGRVDDSQFIMDYPVSCSSRDFCEVGNAGDVLRYNGAQWTTARMIAPGYTFADYSCATATFCAFVGAQGANTFTMNGTPYSNTTSIAAIPRAHDRHPMISCASAEYCAVLAGGEWSHYKNNGENWSKPVSTELAHPSSLSCSSRHLCIAVNDSGQAAVWDGSWRTPAMLDSSAGKLRVSCAPGLMCVAVGSDGKAAVYRNGAWSTPTQIGPQDSELTDISCASTTMCLAVNWQGWAFRFDGTSWSAPTGVAPMGSVSCPSADRCVAGGATAYVDDGGSWSKDAADWATTPYLGTLSCGAPQMCIGTGQQVPDDWTPPELTGLPNVQLVMANSYAQ